MKVKAALGVNRATLPGGLFPRRTVQQLRVALVQLPAPQRACSVWPGEKAVAPRGSCISEFGLWLSETLEDLPSYWSMKGLRSPKYSLLWDELLGFPMYLRMGFRFLSSKASFSFLGLLLC